MTIDPIRPSRDPVIPAQAGISCGGVPPPPEDASLRRHDVLGEGKANQPGFTAAARRLAGLSGLLLGWRPHEFWAATPAELAAILDARGPPDTAGTPDLHRLQELFPDG